MTRRRKAEAALFAKDGLGQEVVQYPTLKKGDINASVLVLQQKLIEKGYLKKGGDDQIFGSKTLEAVRKYQQDHYLTVDGIVGKNTWRSLNE